MDVSTDSFEDWNKAVSSDSIKQIKRPMNAFMLWSKHKRREISKRDSSLHNAQISKLLGEEWKVLSVDQKKPFIEEAKSLMRQHKKDHPDYRYKPRKQKPDKKNNKLKMMNAPYMTAVDYQHDSLRMLSEVGCCIANSHSNYPRSSAFKQYSPTRCAPVALESSSTCHIPDCIECRYERSYFNYTPYRYPYRETIPEDCSCCVPYSIEPRKLKSKSKNCFSVDSLLIKKQRDLERNQHTKMGIYKNAHDCPGHKN